MYKLLIVDDEAMIRQGLHQIIPWAALGFEVADVLAGPSQALAALEAGPVDALLTDIQMPGKTGLQLAEEARKLHPGIKIVVISGYDRFDYAVTALKLQVDDYILKPLDPKAIKDVFVKLRQKLDREQQQERQNRQHQYTENEYGLLRLLGRELLDPQNFRRQAGNAMFIRLVLAYVPPTDHDSWTLVSEQADILVKDYFCLSTQVLYAVFLPSDKAGALLDQLKALLNRAVPANSSWQKVWSSTTLTTPTGCFWRRWTSWAGHPPAGWCRWTAGPPPVRTKPRPTGRKG